MRRGPNGVSWCAAGRGEGRTEEEGGGGGEDDANWIASYISIRQMKIDFDAAVNTDVGVECHIVTVV